MHTHLTKILERHGVDITLTTGAATQSIRAVVGTLRAERDSRAGGYGNQSALTVTVETADLTVALTPHTTTCRHGATLWRVVSHTQSQVATGVTVITLGPINP